MSEKRPRVLHACDLCRRRKIKCDGAHPKCDNCVSASQECVYTEMVKRPRSYKKKKSDVKELEGRLNKIESLLETLVTKGLADGSPLNGTAGSQGRDLASASSESSRSPSPSPDSQDANVDLIDGIAVPEIKESDKSMLQVDLEQEGWGVADVLRDLQKNLGGIKDAYIITNLRTTEVCQSALNISLLSDKGIEWVEKRTGNVGLGEVLREKARAIFVSFFSSVRPYMTEMDGPPKPIGKEMAYLCLRYYDFSPLAVRSVLPKQDLEDIIEAEFGSPEADKGILPNGYSELLVLSSYIASILFNIREVQFLRNEVGLSQEQLSQAIFYYSSIALKYFTRVLFTGHSLNTAKGCLILVLILRCTHGLHFGDAVMTTATRLVYELGLNKAESLKGLSDQEISQRLFLFWSIYWCDQESAMLRGLSSPIAEYDVTLPMLTPQRLLNATLTNYGCLSSLLKIMGPLHRRFLSNMSKEDYQMVTIKHVVEISRQLSEWRRMLPEEAKLNPEKPCTVNYNLSQSNLTSKDLDILANKKCALYLNCSYYHTLLNVYCIPAYHLQWTNRFLELQKDADSKYQVNLTKQETEDLRRSDKLCLNAARSIIMLMVEHSEGSQHLDGLLFLTTIAIITVFTKVLIDTESKSALKDYFLIQQVCKKFKKGNNRAFTLPSDAVISFWESLVHVGGEAMKLKRRHGKKKDDIFSNADKFTDGSGVSGTSADRKHNPIDSPDSQTSPSAGNGGIPSCRSDSALSIDALTNGHANPGKTVGLLNFSTDSSPSSFNENDGSGSALGLGSVNDFEFAESLHQFSSFIHSLEEEDFFYTQALDT